MSPGDQVLYFPSPGHPGLPGVVRERLGSVWAVVELSEGQTVQAFAARSHLQSPLGGHCLKVTPMTPLQTEAGQAAAALQSICHGAAFGAGWWTDPKTGTPIDPRTPHLVPAKLCLIHSEISEAMEGDRKDLMDDKLPHRKMLEVELADALIRIGDLAGALGLDLGGAVAEKLAYNSTRLDHRPEARAAAGGKAY